MDSHKTISQREKSAPDSGGDRRAGSVGERPELAANTTGGDRRSGTPGEKHKHSLDDELSTPGGDDLEAEE